MTLTGSCRLAFSLAALLAAPVVACAADVAAPQVMEAFPKDLQGAFAADAGKVRLVLLLAPS